MVNFIFQVETFIKAILFRIENKDMGKCSGQMEVSTKENGKMGLKMGKGKFIWQAEI